MPSSALEATGSQPDDRAASIPTERGHSRLVRITHTLNSVSFVALVVSGIAILIAHPRLYWGEDGYFGLPALFEFPIETNLSHTGWGRSLHFLAAWVFVINGVIYLVSGLVGRHFRRHLLPRREEFAKPSLVAEIRNHLTLRIPRGGAGPRYSLLQKTAYLFVIFILTPVMILSGLTMSPAVTAAYPELFTLFGGRQSARTVHFLTSAGLVLFLAVHLLMVTLSGFRRQVRAMTVGVRSADEEV